MVAVPSPNCALAGVRRPSGAREICRHDCPRWIRHQPPWMALSARRRKELRSARAADLLWRSGSRCENSVVDFRLRKFISKWHAACVYWTSPTERAANKWRNRVQIQCRQNSPIWFDHRQCANRRNGIPDFFDPYKFSHRLAHQNGNGIGELSNYVIRYSGICVKPVPAGSGPQ